MKPFFDQEMYDRILADGYTEEEAKEILKQFGDVLSSGDHDRTPALIFPPSGKIRIVTKSIADIIERVRPD